MVLACISLMANDPALFFSEISFMYFAHLLLSFENFFMYSRDKAIVDYMVFLFVCLF